MLNLSEEISDQFILFPASETECGVFPDIETLKVSLEFTLYSPLAKFGHLVILKQIKLI